MKFICVGRNYAAHAQELGNAVPAEPLLFIKPDTARLWGEVFHLPAFAKEIHFECELVVQVKAPLKNASIEQAAEALHAVSLGLDFTARDVQDELKAQGLPWEKAKAFDGSALVSTEALPAKADEHFNFSLHVNGKQRQSGDSRLMLTPIPALLAYASRYFTILPEDYVFTGTPAGVGALHVGDVLEGFLGSQRFFKVEVAA